MLKHTGAEQRSKSEEEKEKSEDGKRRGRENYYLALLTSIQMQKHFLRLLKPGPNHYKSLQIAEDRWPFLDKVAAFKVLRAINVKRNSVKYSRSINNE